MSTSEEYLASLGFDTSDMDKSVNRTISILGHLADAFPQIEKQTGRAERALLSLGSSGREAGKGVSSASKSVEEGSSAWKEYTKALNDANSAYREYRRGQVTGEGGGTNISGLSRDQKQNLLDTADAQSANVISALREEERARERATNEAIAQSDKRTNAIIADYSREFAAATETQQKIDAARASQRYATVPNASRNTASPFAVSASNDIGGENYKQAQGAMSAYYAQLEKTTAAQERANQANDAQLGNLPRLRYALYDVSFAAAATGAAMLAGGVAVTTTTAQYEKLFASVERTTTGLDKTPAKLGAMREQLVALTTEIPESFAGITEIATLGNQLNIPQERLVDFTKTVAQFSATTNLTVDASATAFGRLGQLLGETDYRAIGDDISYLGVNAVATESQIVGVAQQIAVSANAANFSTKETLALATALASLGVAPEAARGSILRVFSGINNAVRAGGKELNDYAAISGVSSERFAEQWRGDASAAFTTFVKGLGRDTESLNSNLAGVGITATRDVQAIGLLAQNYGVLTQAQDDTADSAGYLEESFGSIADTTSAKFQLLQNNVLRVFDTIGQQTSGPVKGGLDLLNGALERLNDLLSNPLAAGGVAVSATVVALGGAGIITIGVLARMAATLIAVRTAATEAGVSELNLRGVLDLVTGSATRNAAAVTGASGAQNALAASGRTAAASQAGLNASQGQAAASGGGLTSALGKAGVAGAILSLLPLVPALYNELDAFVNRAIGVEDTVEGMTQKINGLTQAAAQAQAQGALEKLLSFNEAKYSNTGNPYERDNTISGAQAYYNKQTTGQTVPGQEISYFGNGDTINRVAEQAKKNIEDYDAALAALAGSGNLEAVQAGIKLYTDELTRQGLTSAQARELLVQTNAALGLNADGSAQAAAATGQLADSGEDAASAFQSYLDAAFGAANADLALSNSLGSLGEAFITNGAQAAATGPQIQKVIEDIYASSSSGPQAAARMQALFDALVKGGYASASQLSNLSSVIAQLTGGKAVKAATIDMSSFTNGLNKAKVAAAGKSGNGEGGAAKAVRTLADYASDLSGVFKRASDIRFAPTISSDGIMNSWTTIRKTVRDANIDIKNSIRETNDTVRELRATIQSLTSDNQIDRYFLKIAEGYGDSLRASQLRAQIAETDAKIKSSQTDLAQAQADGNKQVRDAQEKTNKTLEGNSQVAIANRAELQGLVSQYQTYIANLAASGLSQAQLQAKTQQLKQEFIAQALQLGYTREGVMSAAKSFDDMSAAIARVPRKITVTANANPALQALNEFEAKARSLATKKYSGGTVTAPSIEAEAAAKASRGADLATALALNVAKAGAAGLVGDVLGVAKYRGFALTQSALLRSGQYFTGGYTGDGHVRAPAGTVHGKEFVLNAVGTKMLPMSMLNAMNQGIAPRIVAPMAGGGGGGMRGPIELSQFDRGLLMEIAQGMGLSITGGALQEAANIGNVNDTRRRSS